MYVKEKLVGKANVYAPNDNCRFVHYTLCYLHELANNIHKGIIEVLHWNNGLLDVLRLFGDDPLTNLDTYGVMLKKYIKDQAFFPNGRVIFALTTPVIEELAKPEFFRSNKDIERYNEKTKEMMSECGVEVNDLFTLTKSFDHSLYSDWVHFGVEGSEILTDKVIEACLKEG